jgi:hypothetical protein
VLYQLPREAEETVDTEMTNETHRSLCEVRAEVEERVSDLNITLQHSTL